jgi:hypothetical protein
MFPHAVSLQFPTARPGFSLKERNEKMRREGENERKKARVKKETAKQSLFCHLVCSSDDVGSAGSTKQRGSPATPARNFASRYRWQYGRCRDVNCKSDAYSRDRIAQTHSFALGDSVSHSRLISLVTRDAFSAGLLISKQTNELDRVVPHEKLIVVELLKKLPLFYGTRYVVTVNSKIFWDVTPCSVVKFRGCFCAMYYPHLQCQK